MPRKDDLYLWDTSLKSGLYYTYHIPYVLFTIFSIDFERGDYMIIKKKDSYNTTPSYDIEYGRILPTFKDDEYLFEGKFRRITKGRLKKEHRVKITREGDSLTLRDVDRDGRLSLMLYYLSEKTLLPSQVRNLKSPLSYINNLLGLSILSGRYVDRRYMLDVYSDGRMYFGKKWDRRYYDLRMDVISLGSDECLARIYPLYINALFFDRKIKIKQIDDEHVSISGIDIHDIKIDEILLSRVIRKKNNRTDREELPI